MEDELEYAFIRTLRGTFDGFLTIEVPINSNIHNIMNDKLYRYLDYNKNAELSNVKFDIEGVYGLYPIKIDIVDENARITFDFDRVSIIACNPLMMGVLAQAMLIRD